MTRPQSEASRGQGQDQEDRQDTEERGSPASAAAAPKCALRDCPGAGGGFDITVGAVGTVNTRSQPHRSRPFRPGGLQDLTRESSSWSNGIMSF